MLDKIILNSVKYTAELARKRNSWRWAEVRTETIS
jgi:hypothetical protein